MMESTSIEYVVERECDLYQVGSLIDSRSYGIATPQDSPYRSLISDAILKLQEEGKLHLLKQKWWQRYCGYYYSEPILYVSELGLANVGGLFVILAAGSCIAVIICLCEFVWKMKNIPRGERVIKINYN